MLVSEDESVPGTGGLILLKTLLNHDIVYKRKSVEDNSDIYPEYPTARDHFIPLASRSKKFAMLNMIKMTANLRVDTTKGVVPAERNENRLPPLNKHITRDLVGRRNLVEEEESYRTNDS